MYVMHATRVADAIEELEDLDRALAAEPDRVAIAGRTDGAMLAREGGDDVRQLADALAIVERSCTT